MLKIIPTSSESDQYSSAQKEISKFPLMYMSLVVRKTDFCICENKDAEKLCGNREDDQRLCFRYTDSTSPLLPKSEISSF